MIKRFTTLAAAAVISVVTIQSATAGGGLRDDYRPAIWQGAYVGGHIGGTFGEISNNFGDSDDVDGFVGGVHVGYNIQNGKTVYGIEGDFTFSGAEIDGTDIDQDYLASIRGRIGYAMNNTLLFATAGVAWTEFSNDNDSETLNGYVVGFGAEHKYSEKLSLRGEVLHYGFEEDYGREEIEVDSTVVRAGITWHMN